MPVCSEVPDVIFERAHRACNCVAMLPSLHFLNSTGIALCCINRSIKFSFSEVIFRIFSTALNCVLLIFEFFAVDT